MRKSHYQPIAHDSAIRSLPMSLLKKYVYEKLLNRDEKNFSYNPDTDSIFVNYEIRKKLKIQILKCGKTRENQVYP